MCNCCGHVEVAHCNDSLVKSKWFKAEREIDRLPRDIDEQFEEGMIRTVNTNSQYSLQGLLLYN